MSAKRLCFFSPLAAKRRGTPELLPVTQVIPIELLAWIAISGDPRVFRAFLNTCKALYVILRSTEFIHLAHQRLLKLVYVPRNRQFMYIDEYGLEQSKMTRTLAGAVIHRCWWRDGRSRGACHHRSGHVVNFDRWTLDLPEVS